MPRYRWTANHNVDRRCRSCRESFIVPVGVSGDRVPRDMQCPDCRPEPEGERTRPVDEVIRTGPTAEET